MIGAEGRLDALLTNQQDGFGPATIGRAVTATLRVSPNGTGTDGLTWATAYQTIQAALDAASTDADDLTLILIGPHATFYDINTTGDPTWAANVIPKGSHRDFTEVRNTHGSATSILKLTGKSSIIDLTFDLGSGSGNGVIMTGAGARVHSSRFSGENLTGAATALHLDGASVEHAKITDVNFHGHVTHMTGLLIDQFGFSRFDDLHFHQCLTAVQFVGADSDENEFHHLDIGDCALGLDIDAGNEQHFTDVQFHHNTRNVDDEVGDSIWNGIFGEFDIAMLPDDLTGISLATGAAGVYGADTELLSAASRDNPFRIVGANFGPDASPIEWYQVRFSDDSGATFYEVIQFISDRREGAGAPSGTEHIFNKGTRISASARDASGSDNVAIWLEIQEI